MHVQEKEIQCFNFQYLDSFDLVAAAEGFKVMLDPDERMRGLICLPQ